MNQKIRKEISRGAVQTRQRQKERNTLPNHCRYQFVFTNKTLATVFIAHIVGNRPIRNKESNSRTG